MKILLKTSLVALVSAVGLVTAATGFAQVQAGHTEQADTGKTFKTADGLNLYLQKDIPAQAPKAVLVIAHGLASHSGVFGDFSRVMNDNGIAVYRFDQRGHGKSDGRDSIHIKSYFEMVEDLRLVVQKARREYPAAPVFVMGHSMGGHISALYGTKYPAEADGFILAAGVLRYNQMNFGHLPRPEPADSFVPGSIALTTLNLPTVQQQSGLSLANDPLMLQKFSVSFVNSFKEGVQYLKDRDDEFTAPVLLVSGGDDVYVLPKDAIDFYQETNSADKDLRLYDGFGHLLMLEPGGQIISKDIADWIKRRIASS